MIPFAIAAVLVGTVIVIWVALLRCPCETAAGVGMTPADGAEVAAGSVAPAQPVMPAGPDRAAPAPAAPLLPRGAAGVTPLPDPDPFDQDADPADMAAALLGQPVPGDEDEVVRRLTAAIDCLANAQILGPFNPGAARWRDTARHALAELTPADLVEVLVQYLGPEAAERASALLAGVPDVIGGAR